MMFRQKRPERQASQFQSLNATQLYCPTCQRAMPVREKLALYVPTGAIYHYVCASCDTMLGRKENGAGPGAV